MEKSPLESSSLHWGEIMFTSFSCSFNFQNFLASSPAHHTISTNRRSACSMIQRSLYERIFTWPTQQTCWIKHGWKVSLQESNMAVGPSTPALARTRNNKKLESQYFARRPGQAPRQKICKHHPLSAGGILSPYLQSQPRGEKVCSSLSLTFPPPPPPSAFSAPPLGLHFLAMLYCCATPIIWSGPNRHVDVIRISIVILKIATCACVGGWLVGGNCL